MFDKEQCRKDDWKCEYRNYSSEPIWLSGEFIGYDREGNPLVRPKKYTEKLYSILNPDNNIRNVQKPKIKRWTANFNVAGYAVKVPLIKDKDGKISVDYSDAVLEVLYRINDLNIIDGHRSRCIQDEINRIKKERGE